MIDYYFGVMGAGKTTVAVALARKALKQGKKVFCNFPLAGTYSYDVSDLGVHLIEDALIILDEAGIEFNNRFFRSMSKEAISFFKYSRQYCCDIVVLSQCHEDTDITIRRLANRFFWVKKSVLGFTRVVRLYRYLYIDDKTKELVYGFKPLSFFDNVFCKYYYRPLYYKYFNSWQPPALPKKDFKKW